MNNSEEKPKLSEGLGTGKIHADLGNAVQIGQHGIRAQQENENDYGVIR